MLKIRNSYSTSSRTVSGALRLLINIYVQIKRLVKFYFSIKKFRFDLVWFLWFLKPLSTIFHLHRGRQCYWWRKAEYSEKTTDLSQVTDNFRFKN